MPARNAKGRFVKRGHAKRRAHHAGHAITKYKTRHVTKYRTRHVGGGKRRSGHRRRHHSGGGVKLAHIALAGAGLAYLAGPASPVKSIPDNVNKLPGAKTFGAPAVAGLVCLGIDRFVKRNKWLRAAGLVGVVLGAVQVGTKGKDFAWVGDAGHPYGADEDMTADVAYDDEDIGDEDIGDEDIGDDEE